MMKNFTFIIALIALLLGGSANAQVTGVYTDFNGFWASNSTTLNPVKPENYHLLLGFTSNGVTYSTGIDDDAILNAQLGSSNFTSMKFRALPIVSVPNTAPNGVLYYVGFGQLADGIDDGATDPTTLFSPNPSSAELASYLTDGKKGLDMSTGLTNIPSGSTVRLNLSSNGITLGSIGDGVPDLLVTQMAVPSTGGTDKIKFIDSGGGLVGSEITMTMSNDTNFPIVGKWYGDFFDLAAKPQQVRREKPIKFFAIELSQLGITSSNYQDAVALVYTPGGTSDPAFIAYNEPSIGVASKIGITSSSISTDCDGNITDITIELQDSFDDPVEQSGFVITATITTGPGQLLGTLTKTTNASGQAVFDDLAFEVGGDHKITFSSSSLKAAVTSLITPATNCNPSGELIWDGSTSTDWSDPTNWTTNTVPNANFDVIIPSGAPNYPILDVDTGAKNLSMDAGSSIDLNGHLFTIAGAITIQGGTPTMSGSTADSELYMSGTSAQVVPANFLVGNFDKFTVENAAGVSMLSDLGVTGVLNIKSGTFTTNGNVTLICNFGSNGGTGQIAELTGNISGNVTAEQCFPGRRAFRFVSASLNTTSSIHANWQEGALVYNDNTIPAGYGTHITGVGPGGSDGTNGFDWSPSGNPSMFTFSNTGQAWAEIPNTNSTNLTAGTPYRLMIRGDRYIDITDNGTTPTNTKLRALGTVEKGPVTMNNFSSSSGDFNFFGNPFHAAVDLNKVLLRANNVNPNFYYMWDPTLGGTPTVTPSSGDITAGGRGAYVTVDLTTGVGSSSEGASAANLYLQPVQAAFFVTANEGGTPVLTFNESDKNVEVAQTATFRTNTIYRNPYVFLNLFTQDNYINQKTASDGLRIKFDTIFSNDVDMKDAPKLGNLDENLSRIIGTNYISIESRDMPVDGEELQLFINNYRFTDYTFLATLNDIPDNVTAFLKDNYLNTQTELLANTSTPVNFTIDPDIAESIAWDRFSIIFAVTPLRVDDNKLTTWALYPNPTMNGNFFISLPNVAGNEAAVSVYNVLGQKVYQNTETVDASNRINVQAGRLNAGVYIVELLHNGKRSTQKLIIR